MIPNREYINISGSAFHSYILDQPRFDFIWHYHPEYEINIIMKGQGKRLVGDHVEEFSIGEITVFGPNLPHTFVSREANDGIYSYGIQFSPELFPPGLLVKEEFSHIRRLFNRSRRGITFKSKATPQVVEMVERIHTKRGIDRYASLLKFLVFLGKKMNFRYLASSNYIESVRASDKNRIDIALKYIHDNFHNDLSLAEMAEITNLSPTSFCRYFKQQTGKSFIAYVNDWKIGRACQLLIRSNIPIAQVAFDSGFNNVVHFNRTFKDKKQTSPGNYRRQYISSN